MGSTHSVRDLSERYGVTEHTVLAWIHSGELRAVNVGRRPGAKKPRWRIPATAVEAFEQLRAPGPLPRRARRHRPADVIPFYQ
jgi:excisionase family DNA binding protein